METIENQESPVNASELFTNESLSEDELNQALDTLTRNRDELARVIVNGRGIINRARDRVDENARRASRFENVAYARNSLRDRDRQALRSALESMYGDSPRVELDSPEWVVWFRLIVRVGVWTGHASDVHTLARELGSALGFDAEDIYRSESSELRDSEGHFPEPVSSEEAIANAWRRFAGSLSYHPSDPRLLDGWTVIYRNAKSAELCQVWDDMADTLGLPAVEISKSGYVTVSGTFSVSVYVEGVVDDEVEISTYDVLSALGSGDIEIDEWDTSELELD